VVDVSQQVAVRQLVRPHPGLPPLPGHPGDCGGPHRGSQPLISLRVIIICPISDFAPAEGVIGASEEEDDEWSVEDAGEGEAVESEDGAEADEGVVEVDAAEVVFVDFCAADVEECEAGEGGEVGDLIALAVDVVLDASEDDHDKVGGDEGEQRDEADQ
jgi:hypothetical protein